MIGYAHIGIYHFDSRAFSLELRVIKNSYVKTRELIYVLFTLLPVKVQITQDVKYGHLITQQVVISLTNNIV